MNNNLIKELFDSPLVTVLWLEDQYPVNNEDRRHFNVPYGEDLLKLIHFLSFLYY